MYLHVYQGKHVVSDMSYSDMVSLVLVYIIDTAFSGDVNNATQEVSVGFRAGKEVLEC